MNIAIFGTGSVGRTLAEKLVTQGHSVTVGTRNPAETLARTDTDMMGNGPFAPWHAANSSVQLDTFANAAAASEVILLATNGLGTLPSIEAAGIENIGSKIIIDISNPLDFSKGMPPTLFVSNDDSLGEQVQRAVPNARVVKSLNTLWGGLMVAPELLADGNHSVFVSGNDTDAKATVSSYLTNWFGWKPSSIVDLGDITTARGTEMYLPLWLRLFGATGSGLLNIHVVR
jgi:8-hydroxy-5-deazaflavin:NADPH oxidoreductase